MERAPVASELSAEFADLPLQMILRINELADDFEAAWQSGRNPNVGDFVDLLGTSSAATRAALREHLTQLAVELDSSPMIRRGRTDGIVERETDSSGETPAPLPLSERLELPRLRCRSAEGESIQPVVVGEYQILERLGAGGMGVVYKALHRRLGRTIAIKFPRIATEFEPNATARFVREARLVGRLSHPHIVQALDAGDSEYGPYLVTEFIDGETIESLVRREGPMPLPRAMSLTAQAASALGYAHSQGVIHRDIKPSNLYLGSDGLLRIFDFGLAKLRFDDGAFVELLQSSDRTQSGAFLGTVGYAAPEQLRGTDSVDHRADIYGLGCVFYFMLTGQSPHEGTLADRLLAPRKGLAPLLRRRCRDVPPAVETTWRGMVASVPRKRVESMALVESIMRSDVRDVADPKCNRRAVSRRLLRAVCALALGAVLACAITLVGLNWSFQGDDPTASPPYFATAPFSASEARRYQQRWARQLGTSMRLVNSNQMPLVLIPAGEFMMGMSDDPVPELPIDEPRWWHRDLDIELPDQRPPHRVVLTKPFYLGETEVTFGQFRRFVDKTGYVTEAEKRYGWGMENGRWVESEGYSWKSLGEWQTGDDYPVNNVTWNDAARFCEWLTASSDDGVYRLPTEAEWEFACRAGSTTTFNFGNDPAELPAHAWLQINSRGVYWPVGLKRANPFGLYDMYGNRHEWCLDTYASDFYTSSPVRDPVNNSDGPDAVMRGGMHASPPAFVTSAYRWRQARSATNYAGFRVVLDVR